jgi:hypothetical protein
MKLERIALNPCIEVYADLNPFLLFPVENFTEQLAEWT